MTNHKLENVALRRQWSIVASWNVSSVVHFSACDDDTVARAESRHQRGAAASVPSHIGGPKLLTNSIYDFDLFPLFYDRSERGGSFLRERKNHCKSRNRWQAEPLGTNDSQSARCLDCVWPCVSYAIMVECEWWPLGTSWFINQLCRLHIQLIDDNGFAWSIIGRSVGRIGPVPSPDDKCGILNHSKPISTDGQRWVIGCGFGIYRFTRKV